MNETSDQTPETAAETEAQAALTGAELIADHVTRLPNAPGVYRMISRRR